MSRQGLDLERRIITAANFRPVQYWLGMAGWTMFFISPILPGWLIGRVFTELQQNGASTQSFIYLGALAVAELAIISMMVLAHPVYIKGVESSKALMRANAVEAQLASGGPRSGPRKTAVGDVLVRLRDDPQDVMFLLDNWTDMLGSLVYGIVAFWFLASIDLPAALAGAVPLLLTGWGNGLLANLARVFRVRAREASSAVSGYLAAAIEASLTVKVTGAHGSVLRRLDRLNATRAKAAVGETVWNDVMWSINTTASDVFLGIALAVAARGALTAGEIAQFAAYLAGLIWLPMRLGMVFTGRRRAEVSAGRIEVLLPEALPGGEDPLVHHRPLPVLGGPQVAAPASPPAIALERLSVEGLTVAGRGLFDVSLVVERGSLTVVSGVVGSGKTSLLRAIIGLLDIDSGVVRWNGAPVEDRAAFFVPPRSAYVAQAPRLFAESLADNLRLGFDVSELDLLDAIELAAFDSDVEALPAGLATMVGARGVRLSGGQAQRAAAARALARKPELLVLDDLTSALDVETELLLWSRLAAAGYTVLAASNRPAALARADSVVALSP